MDTRRGNTHCSMDRCEGTPAAFLAEQALCLNHFLVQCYNELDRIDPRSRKDLRDAEQAQARKFVDECSNQALNICLQSESLSNLEKGQLLDILLWAGEVYELVRPSGRSLFGELLHPANPGACAWRSPGADPGRRGWKHEPDKKGLPANPAAVR